MPLDFVAQVSAPELDDDETSINRQVVRLMGLTEDTEDNHWLSIHALRIRLLDYSTPSLCPTTHPVLMHTFHR